jgi:hypothetical protein
MYAMVLESCPMVKATCFAHTIILNGLVIFHTQTLLYTLHTTKVMKPAISVLSDSKTEPIWLRLLNNTLVSVILPAKSQSNTSEILIAR